MEQSKPSRLESWKDIAAYLGREVRTAMRWAKQGMPVHHDPGGKKGRVYAYTEELDRWREQPEAKGLHEVTARRPWWRRVPALIGAAVLLALVVVGALVVGYSALWRLRASGPLASVALREDRFVGVDKAGRVLWTYPLPKGPTEPPPTRAPGIVYVGDFGDANKIALVSVPFAEPNKGEREVYCFSETGKLLWRFKPEETLTFGSGDYGPPWQIHTWLVRPGSEAATIALGADHDGWWPSVLTVLDSHGRELGKFVNSGQTFTIAWMDSPQGLKLLAGGVRNQDQEVSGRLAVLDANHLSGSSPESAGSDFECKSCPPGRPLKYFVFPRSELNAVTISNYNEVLHIAPSDKGVQVQTIEARTSSSPAWGMFEFTSDFQLKSARWSDGYREIHRQLEREGKIKHSWDHCPDRFGPRLVRSWDPQHGWRDIHPQALQK